MDRTRTPTLRAVVFTLLLLAAVALPVQAQQGQLTPAERDALAGVVYLISAASLGGVWWTYRHHMHRTPDEPVEAPGKFCPRCGAPAQGPYCARCGAELREAAS